MVDDQFVPKSVRKDVDIRSTGCTKSIMKNKSNE